MGREEIGGARITPLLVTGNRVKGGGRALPPSPGCADFRTALLKPDEAEHYATLAWSR